MKYNPEPFDTKNVLLPQELKKLEKQLAENAHDVWARQRIKEGWTYGEKRDDNKKTHPCLVPYDELPENEKEYDKKTAMETLRLIIALGYRIIK